MLVVLVSAAAIGGFYALSRIGPKSYAVAERRATISKQQAEKLRLLAEQAAARWDEIKKMRLQDRAPFGEDDLAAIGEAAVSRFQYENQVDTSETRYPALKKELHERMGENLRTRSTALEKSARAEEKAGRYAQAAELYGAALELESLIIYDYPESSYADNQRSVYLSGQLRVMTARPLWTETEQAESAGEAAFAAGDLSGAIAAIDRASRINYRLEHEFQGLTKGDAMRSHRLERRLATLESLIVRNHALALLAKGEKAAEAGDFSAVPAMREAVEADMRKMVDEFPQGDFSTPELTGDIVRRAQNAAATPDIVAIRRDLAAFETAVSGGASNTSRLLENLQRAVQRLREAYPKSDLLDKRTDERIGYLFDHRGDVATVSAAVLASLRPVPGTAVGIARTETSQQLYTLVMGENPSAAKGGNRPVESLTRGEAERFCIRLGWLLARPVRLPSVAEFRAAAGTPEAKTLASHARAIDNSDGTPGTVPASAADAGGVCDLLGNVSEWLSGGDAGGTAVPVGGGDAENTLAQLAKIPVESVTATQRSRFVGFRFVVEKPAAR